MPVTVHCTVLTHGGAVDWGAVLQAGSRGFDSQWCNWNFSLIQFFRPHYAPGIDSASDRNKYREYFLGFIDGRCVGLILSPLYADYHEIWRLHPLGTLRACPGGVSPLLFSRLAYMVLETILDLIYKQIVPISFARIVFIGIPQDTDKWQCTSYPFPRHSK